MISGKQNRREFFKNCGLGLTTAGLSPLFFCSAESEHPPNIIYILADDLGYGDLGCYGCRDIPTPNIDRMAHEGKRFTRFYASSPVCTPSRACTLTGRYPQAVDMTRVLMGKGGMGNNIVTIAEILKGAGYNTGCVGKWHLGYKGDSLPNQQGFDYFFGHRGGKIDYFKYTDSAQKIEGEPLGKHDLYENGREVFSEEYATDLFTDKTVQYINSVSDSPFFLYLAYNAPHYARRDVLQAPESYIKKMDNINKSAMRQTYAAMVSCMDDGIGRIIQTLFDLNLDRNTLVMFIGDNGADPKHGGSNYPLRGGKWTLWEGGIRVPFITRWPGIIPEDSVSDESLHMTDLSATTINAAGLSKTSSMVYDGINCLDVLTSNQSLPERFLFFEHNNFSAVIRGKWKMLKNNEKMYLFDLKDDPGEEVNLADRYPDILKDFDQAFRNWKAALVNK